MNQTKKVTFAAIFVALSFAFSFLSITLANAQIGITEFPLMASGFILGPFYGSLVGLIKDVLTMMMKGYPPSLFTISPIILGLIPGLFVKFVGIKKLSKSIPLLACAIFLATILRTVNNTFALYFVIGLDMKAIIAGLPLRIVPLIAEGVIYVIIFRSLLPIVHKMFFDDEEMTA